MSLTAATRLAAPAFWTPFIPSGVYVAANRYFGMSSPQSVGARDSGRRAIVAQRLPVTIEHQPLNAQVGTADVLL